MYSVRHTGYAYHSSINDIVLYLVIPFYMSLQPLGLMQFLDSDATVSDEDIDRMHIRDNLKAVTVSSSIEYRP